MNTYENLRKQFVDALIMFTSADSVEVLTGRKFDRIMLDKTVKYFVERSVGAIYGAKSAAQFNPRRFFGTLHTIRQMDWETGRPTTGSELEKTLTAREAQIAAGYKKRGRPRKNPTTSVTP